MSTNYVNKEYLIKNFQNFADKLKTIYQKQENVEFHVVDSYSKLASNPKVSMVSYVINDETVGTDIKKKGFYYYDIKEATPKWTYIEISGGSGTTNYNALLNKPSINGVELRGNKTLADLGITNYDDTQIKKDIADLDTNKQDKTDNALDTTDKTVVGAINEINDSLLDNVTFSADYKNIIINRKSGLNPYTIPIASIIHNAKIIELNDVDTTNIGDGKTLVYDGATQKHKYVDSTGTDELVKMDSTTDAKHLSELIDKSTIVNDNGVLKTKKLDGQEVTITEINYLKGLTMNVMDLVNAFANGGVKVLNTPVNTHADLSKLDRSTFLDGISYIVYVLADETHSGAKTTYLCDKTSSTFFGNADSQRNFTTDPINLANEVTGKLGTANIDVDALWKLLTINDTYKTLTTKNEPFGTHGAKALYDELVADIGKKANATDLTTHTSDTDIHITSAERTLWNTVSSKVNKSGDTMTGTLSIKKSGDDATLLTFDTERAWSFKQGGTGADTSLDLVSSGNDKNFRILNADKTKGLDLRVTPTKTEVRIDGKKVYHAGDKPKLSELTNDAGFITSADIGNKANATDLTTHTSNKDIHITTADKTKWNKIDNKIDKASITTTIDSSSTDTQVPSAKAVYDELDNKVDKTDLTSHTGDTNIHITTAERDKWNEADNKIDKTDIVDNLTSTNTDKPLSANQGKVLKGEVDKKANDNEVIKKTAITTTINSASTNTQVPSAKSVKAELDNKADKTSILTAISASPSDSNLLSEKAIKNELDKKSSIIELNNLRQGILVTQTSMNKNILLWDVGHYYFNSNDIWKSYEHIPNTTYAPHVYVTSVKPVKYENTKNEGTWFRQIKVEDHLGTSFIRTIYTPNVKDVVDLENGKLLSSGSDTGWQRVSTSVADVPKTNIAPADETKFIGFKGNSMCNYCVVNGVCYVSLWNVKVSVTGRTVTGVILPKPKTGFFGGTCLVGGGDADPHAYAHIIPETGELKINVKDANTPLYGTFSYQVEEQENK